MPKLTAIYYNDQLICTGPQDAGQFVTTITLDHTLYTGLTRPPQRPIATRRPETPEPISWLPPTRQPEYKPQPPVQPEPQVVQPSQIKPNGNFEEFDFECGVSDYKVPTATGLVFGGQNAVRGQYPW